jgi:quinol monooxygenase YgiN
MRVEENSEVSVVVQLKPKDEFREELLRMLSEVVRRSRMLPDCISYEVFVHVQDHDSLVIFQTWTTHEAFETHWLYTDLPRIKVSVHMLSSPLQYWKLRQLALHV